MTGSDASRTMLRHAVATLAYRGVKSIRHAPEHFASLSIGAGSRTPLQIVGHISDLLDWALIMSRGEMAYHQVDDATWDAAVERFYRTLSELDEYLGSENELRAPAEKLFQGPIADALTHVGQLMMLRRVAEAPVRAENFFLAEIEAGNVGPDQPAPKQEFG